MAYNICVFGDSIAFGKYDSRGGWVVGLNEFLETRYLASKGDESFIYNLSISGNQSDDILARFEREVNPRFLEKREFIIIFATGLNDSAIVHSRKDNWVTLKNLEENLYKLIVVARKYSDKIIFIGATLVDQEIVDPMPWDTDKSYHNEDIEKYNEALQNIAKENGAGYIPLFEKFMAADHKKLLHDGAHPNSAGHRMIFETVRDYLLDKKII